MPMSDKEIIAFQVKLSVEIWRDIYKKLTVDFNNSNPLVLSLFPPPTGVTYEGMRQLLEAAMDNPSNVGSYGKVLEVFKREYDTRVKNAAAPRQLSTGEVIQLLTEEEAANMFDPLTGGFANITLGLMAERNKVRPEDAAELVQDIISEIYAMWQPRTETPNPEADRGGEESEGEGEHMEVEDEPKEPEDHRKKRRI
jgi:hypothetical protein